MLYDLGSSASSLVLIHREAAPMRVRGFVHFRLPLSIQFASIRVACSKFVVLAGGSPRDALMCQRRGIQLRINRTPDSRLDLLEFLRVGRCPCLLLG